MRRAQGLFLLVAVLALLPGSAGAQAQTFYELELVGGVTFPDPELVDDGFVGALRFGRSTSKSTAFDFTVGYQASDYVDAAGEDVGEEWETWYVELNETLTFNNRGTLRPALSLGIGYSWTDSLEVGAAALGVDQDGLTANCGFKLEIWATRHWAVIPAAEIRYFKEREEQRTDVAATVALAYRFNR